MKNSYKSYIKQVERLLDLPQFQRKKLMRGFQLELKEKYSEAPNAKRLVTDIGQPEEVASAILEAVDSKGYMQFNSTRFHWFRITVVVFALLLMISIVTIVYLDASELKRVEINIVRDSIPTQYVEDAEDE